MGSCFANSLLSTKFFLLELQRKTYFFNLKEICTAMANALMCHIEEKLENPQKSLLFIIAISMTPLAKCPMFHLTLNSC